MQYKAKCVYGCFVKEVMVNVDHKLQDMPYAQAGIRDYHDTYHYRYTLVSYETEVAYIEDNQFVCTCIWGHTTAKHISAFLHQYAPWLTYLDAKKSCAYNCAINLVSAKGTIMSLETGEVFDSWKEAEEDYKKRHAE